MSDAVTVAQVWARRLHERGVRRVYGLTGSHVKPIWDELTRLGVEIIGVRHEQAAVHMAHAAAEVTGQLGVAILTTGPGFTNGISGLATAQHARQPVLVLSALAPTPQLGRGAFEETAQSTIAAPVTKYSDTVWSPEDALSKIDAAIDAALGGLDHIPGPSYLDTPVDVLRSPSSPTSSGFDRPNLSKADEVVGVEAGADVIRQALRPLVVSGHGAKGAAKELAEFVEAVGGLYLDTRESRGLIESDRFVPAMRGKVMRDVDVVITVGRRLDYELAYGSPAIWNAQVVRIGLADEHLHDNRDDATKVEGDIAAALSALTAALGETSVDKDWITEVIAGNDERVAGLAVKMAAEEPGPDGRMHPNRLLAAINDIIDDDTIVTADGGDLLSFASVGLKARTLITPGPFGCLGVGVPFAVAAALEHPDRRVISVSGDGAFGFNAMEVDTAKRHGAKVVFVVSNNEAWGIENRDRIVNYDDAPFTTELPGCRFDLVAQGLGVYGEHVEDPADLPAALQRCLANAPAVLDVSTTPEAISPDFKNGLADLGDHHALRAWNDLEKEYRSR